VRQLRYLTRRYILVVREQEFPAAALSRLRVQQEEEFRAPPRPGAGIVAACHVECDSVNPVPPTPTLSTHALMRFSHRRANAADLPLRPPQTASGMVWCSAAVWSSAAELFDNRLPLLNIKGTTLGSFKLKGVSDNVELVHCTLAKAALTVGEVGFQNELIYRRPATLDREA